MRFEEIHIIPSILKALKDENYESPTPIQEKAIPLVLKGYDVFASAQTGTGKTAAFAIPIIQHLVNDKEANAKQHIKALIVTPTRELALQIGENFTSYGKYTSIKNVVIFGGVNQNSQTKQLNKGIDVLIATPGRLLDLMNQGFISLRNIEYFVLDEADRMLDMGFINDIKKIIKELPQKRQSLFFSATMPQNIIELSKSILIDPKQIAVSPTSSTAETIQQLLYYTNKSDKKNLLLSLLEDKDMDQVLIFSRTKHGADRIVRDLQKSKIEAAAIHGDKAQNQRQKALNRFKDKEIRILVATDIAARGIDIDKLQYVINYDIPNIAETYVHRIGRSGRAGESGMAISICEPEENEYVKEIENLIQLEIPVARKNPYPQTESPMSKEEKKSFEKEKQKRKNEFFAQKNKRGGRR